MPRQEAKLEIHQFTGGLNTDTTELTTPQNTSVDELNFNLTKEGTRRRRLGMDLEDPSTVNIGTGANLNFIGNYRWNSVGKKGDLSFEVIQTGNILRFFTSSTVPLADGEKPFTVNLDDFKAPLATNTNIQGVSMASGKGALFVAGENIVPFYITYNDETDGITATRLNLKIRDLTQLDVQDPENGTLTPQRRYDLLNQGWYQTGVIIGSSTQVIKIKTKSKNPNTSIPGYDGAILDGYIETFGEAPPKTKPWWIGKGTITVDIHIKKPGIFNDTKETKEVEAFSKEAYDLYFGGNTVAPLGHYIVDPFYKNRSVVSGVNGLEPEVQVKRPNAVAFYGGRAFFGLENTIYFSQIIFDDLQAAERCYQEADPTSEDTIGLIASDGGVITIPDMGNIIRLFVVEGALLIFADNGVWVVYSPQGRGFSATDFTVDYVTNISATGYYNIVEVEGYPVYWGEQGIFAIQPIDERIAYKVQDLTEGKILNYYSSIPPLSKRYSKGAYDFNNRRIIWLWQTSTDPLQNRFYYDNVLNYSLTFDAFFPYSITQHEAGDENDTTLGVCGIVNANATAIETQETDVIINIDNFAADVLFHFPLDFVSQGADISPSNLGNISHTESDYQIIQATNGVSSPFVPLGSWANSLNTNAGEAGHFSLSHTFPSLTGTEDITIEMWFRNPAFDPAGGVLRTQDLFELRRGATATEVSFTKGDGTLINPQTTFTIRVREDDGTVIENYIDTGLTAVDNKDYFVSMTRTGDKMYWHVNGNLIHTTTLSSASAVILPTQFNFGNGTNTEWFCGDLRFTAAARYTNTNYTVPTDSLIHYGSYTAEETVVSESDGDVIVNTSFVTETPIGIKYIAIKDIGNNTTGAELAFSDFTDDTFSDWSSTGFADDYESYINTFYHLSDDSMLYMQTPWIYTYIKKTSNTFPDAEGDGEIADGEVGGGWNE